MWLLSDARFSPFRVLYHCPDLLALTFRLRVALASTQMCLDYAKYGIRVVAVNPGLLCQPQMLTDMRVFSKPSSVLSTGFRHDTDATG